MATSSCNDIHDLHDVVQRLQPLHQGEHYVWDATEKSMRERRWVAVDYHGLS